MADHTTPSRTAVDRICPGGVFAGAERLAGGISAETWSWLFTKRDGETLRVVARFPSAAVLSSDAGALRRECAALEAISREGGVPVPALLLVDLRGAVLGRPGLVMALSPGVTPDAARVSVEQAEAMGAVLARVHCANIEDASVLVDRHAELARWLARWEPTDGEGDAERAAVGALRELAPWRDGPRSLLHGDFWAGNVLMDGDEIVGVVDWEDAALGHPFCDLAWARLELFWLSGGEAMGAFTDAYFGAGGAVKRDAAAVARWDLTNALRPAVRRTPCAEGERERERLARARAVFLRGALARLGGAPPLFGDAAAPGDGRG